MGIKGARVDFEMDTTGARRNVNLLTQRINNQNDEVRKLTQSVNQMSRKLEAANKRNAELAKGGAQKTTDWGRKVTQLAASYIGLQQGIAAVRAIHQQMIREAEQGLQRLDQLVDPFKGIRQISKSTEEFQGNRDRIRDIAKREGLPEDQVARLFFSASSAGVLDQLPSIVEGARFLQNPEAAATAVGAFRSPQLFGAEEAGSGRQILSKLGRAGAESKFTVDDIIQGAILSAGPAAAIGSSDEELLGTLSATSQSFASIERAATAINAVSNKLAKGVAIEGADGTVTTQRFDQGGLVAEFQRLVREQPEAFQAELDSNIRFAQGARAIQKSLASGELGNRIGQISAENETFAFLGTQQKIFTGDEETSTAIDARKAKEARAQATQQAAIKIAEIRQRADLFSAGSLEEDGINFLGAARRGSTDLAASLGIDPSVFGAGIGRGGAREVERLIAIGERQIELAEQAQGEAVVTTPNGPGSQ